MIKLKQPVTNPCVIFLLNSCKNINELKQIHARLITDDYSFPCQISFQLSKLASIYAISPHGSLDYAATIFSQQQNPPNSLYNALIRGFSSSNKPLEAVSFYRKMLQNGLRPNNLTFPFVIKACIKSSVYQNGILIHTHVLKCGLESDPYILSSLIHLYANGKDLKSAEHLFDICPERNTVSWNAMIDGYVKVGSVELARRLFDRMVCKDVISWNTMINGYAIIGDIEDATKLFDEMPVRNIISWNSMMAGYVKCGNVDEALKMFNKMPCRDVISWNSILACYAQSGKSNEAFAFFDEMKATGIKPTESTIVSLLSACGHLGALDQGLRFHSYINDHKIKISSILSNALIDMYAKCGNISRAAEVFHSMEFKDVLAWNTMITGMAMHGHADVAQNLFKEMQKECTVPNDITFVSMFSAFRHAGMTEEGQQLLACMNSKYGVEPKVEHYGCVIDLLARFGKLNEALDIIDTMPMEPNACALGALLGGCRIHGNVDFGGEIGKHLIHLQPQHSGRYILLSNIYAAAKRWDDARKIRNLMKCKGVSKVPGVSVIELKGSIHRFVAGDRSHPESNAIYKKWFEISTLLIQTTGYFPDTEQVLIDIEEEEKEHVLSVHSEKLAIAYGFMHLGQFETIRIVKNLRVCRDCHDVTKLISKIYSREIVVRDRNRFHHFKDGHCSCLDFW